MTQGTNAELITALAVVQIRPSATNPRKHFDPAALHELADSVRVHGVLQPVLVRPINAVGEVVLYELVAGERRWRAAKEAGLASIPATVRDLTDKEVLEIQVVENLQRADLHPIEEAEGYRQLHKTHGYSIEQLAAKVGKSRAYVYGRLKLCELPEIAKKRWWDGMLNASTALLVARIPSRELAERATLEIVANRGTGEPMNYTQALSHIQNHYMCALAHAPFKAADATLLPKAGACTQCPKRTGNQRDLFGDIRSVDICTDPICYRAKLDAHGEGLVQEAESRGLRVLGKSEAKKIFESADHFGPRPQLKWNAPWVEAVSRDGCEYGIRGQSLKAALGKHLPPAALARDPRTGRVVEIYRKDDVRKAAIAAGKLKSNGPHKPSEQERAAASRAREKARFEAELSRRLVAEVVATAEACEPRDIWKALALGAIGRAWHDTAKEICLRRGLEAKNPSQVLDKLVMTLSAPQLRGLVAEVILGPFIPSGHEYRVDKGLRTLVFQTFSIDQKAMESTVRKEFGEKKKPAKGKAKAKPEKNSTRRKKSAPNSAAKDRKPKASTPGVCRECGCTDENCEQCFKKTGEPCHWVEPDLCSACTEGE